jgi:hypothetical protein
MGDLVPGPSQLRPQQHPAVAPLPLRTPPPLNPAAAAVTSGSKGNKTEEAQALVACLLASGLTIGLYVYYVRFQTYV